MGLQRIILETFEMVVFTFLIGIFVAWLILVLTKIFCYFDTRDVLFVASNLKNKLAHERKQWSNIRKILPKLEQNTEMESIKYFYENKNKYNTEEIVDDLYHLAEFYKGVNERSSNEPADDTNYLTRFYKGIGKEDNKGVKK
jgi:hypothetical protein